MSTPRTDAVAIAALGITWHRSFERMTEHARTLETELQQTQAARLALSEIRTQIDLYQLVELDIPNDAHASLVAFFKALDDIAATPK